MDITGPKSVILLEIQMEDKLLPLFLSFKTPSKIYQEIWKEIVQRIYQGK